MGIKGKTELSWQGEKDGKKKIERGAKGWEDMGDEFDRREKE